MKQLAVRNGKSSGCWFDELHGILGRAGHDKHKVVYVVQNLAARKDRSLMTFEDIRDGSGFDFDGIMNLTAGSRPDYVAAEMIWQDGKSHFGEPAFNPDWTETAARSYVQRVKSRVVPLIHVEATSFPPDKPTVSPTEKEFQQTVKLAVTAGGGATVYE